MAVWLPDRPLGVQRQTRDGERPARWQAQRVVDAVRHGNWPPLGWIAVLFAGDGTQGIAATQHFPLRDISRLQPLPGSVRAVRAPLLERAGERRAYRCAVLHEQSESLLEPLDHTLEDFAGFAPK